MKHSLIILLTILFSINHALPAHTNDFGPKTSLIYQKLDTEQLRQHYATYKLYKQQYNKPDEDDVDLEYLRFRTYMENVEKIRQHNERYERGEETYEMGINQFTDMLPEELDRLNGDRSEMENISGGDIEFSVTVHKDLPEAFDWRPLGAVTPVKNQGNCGSCWTFSATGALEGQHFMRTGKLVSLSEQNLLDCSGKEYGNYGCSGGLAIYAYDYVIHNDGIDTGESYTYEAKEGKCRYKNETRGTTCFRRVIFAVGDEIKLQAAVAEYGPVAVSMDADDLFFYKGGIYGPTTCTTWTNHAVLAVGYGFEERMLANGTKIREDYWIIKNSWGKGWGEDGYFRLARNKNNMCGVVRRPNLPYTPIFF